MMTLIETSRAPYFLVTKSYSDALFNFFFLFLAATVRVFIIRGFWLATFEFVKMPWNAPSPLSVNGASSFASYTSQ